MTSRVTVPMDLEEKDARLKLICVQMQNVSMATVLINFTDTSKFKTNLHMNSIYFFEFYFCV